MKSQKDQTLREIIGENLKQIRKKQNLTLKEAEVKTGKAFDEISRIEGGKRNFNIDALEKLAAGYGLRVIVKFKNVGE